MKRPAVFIDRDGTISEEVGYVNHPSRFRVFPYSAEAIRILNDNDWLAIVITNQAGVARGYFPEEMIASVHDRLKTDLENAQLDAIYYCAHHPKLYPHHQETLWGINACDQLPAKPGGSNAYGAQNPIDGENDGTVAPTAALAAITFLPAIADRTLQDLSSVYRAKAWGKYGFANAINPVRDWYDTDVIGIDLGMMLLAIENHRSGLPWRLTTALPSTKKALATAGFHNAR